MAGRRVFIGPGEIAGYFNGLNRGLKAIGMDVSYFPLDENKFGYSYNQTVVERIYCKFTLLRKSKITKVIGIFGQASIRLFIFVYALFKADFFIFNGFRPFLTFYELRILRFFGKKIIVVYLGSDARPSFLSGRMKDDLDKHNHNKLLHDCYKDVLRRKRNIELVEEAADFIINHTATSQFFSIKQIRFTKIGIPLNVKSSSSDKRVHRRTVPRKIRVLHAPSRPLAKGSKIVENLVLSAKNNGLDCELIKLINVPNSEVLNVISTADFVFDEVYSDTPLGVLGAEAASLGIPCLVSGYVVGTELGDEMLKDIYNPNFVNPAGLEREFTKLIIDHAYRSHCGKLLQREFLNKWGEKIVAQRFLKIIEDDVPKSWFFSPFEKQYLHGWGLSKYELTDHLINYIKEYNARGLHLDHNPELKNIIMRFVDTGQSDG